MIRFVVGPDGAIVPDLKRKLPGRGVWVTAAYDAVATAVQRKAFARAFKREVKVPADLPALLGELLERSVLDSLAIVHKSGLVMQGFTRVEAALRSEAVVAMIHASDASDDGVRKLGGVVARRFGEGGSEPEQITALTSQQLDLALGRSNVVHAAVLAGPASESFLARYRGLQRFRNEELSARSRIMRRRDEPAEQKNA
jgi:predicted RNA-binding protein YlxR (DUF448 family)